MSAYDFEFSGIDDEPISLTRFQGSPIFLVNTASQCGYTPQYAELQSLWVSYRDRGLIVLGVPSNDFGGQEPGDETEIKRYCVNNYEVDFPLTGKTSVIGVGTHPFYRWVVEELGEVAAPKWNFHKYLIGRDGHIAGLWQSSVSPLDSDIINTIDGLLGST